MGNPTNSGRGMLDVCGLMGSDSRDILAKGHSSQSSNMVLVGSWASALHSSSHRLTGYDALFGESSRDRIYLLLVCLLFALGDNNVTHMKDDNDSNNTDSLSVAAKTTNETREYIYQQVLNE
jgi:hypothetical protein